MREWVELCLTHKGGKGDKTGLLPEKALKMISKLPPFLPLGFSLPS